VLAGQRQCLVCHPLRLAVGGLADCQPGGREQAIYPNEVGISPAAGRQRKGFGASVAAPAGV